jgi:predicted TIM-barrel fold metal-dependent hydrolase
LLTFDEALFALPAIANPHFASELARAMNDYTIEQWLSRDERLAGSLIVPTQYPERAVEEIKRAGGHRQMAQVITAGSGLGPPLGHPVFHPIYEAACEAGLPLCIHVGGSGGNNYGAGGGMLNYYIEFHALGMQTMITHVASFLANGVFEQFPQLKVVFLEGGVAWLPTLLWQLDDSYKRSWRELPKMKRLPSEYVVDHIRLSTQPFELSPKREQMIKMMRLMQGDKVLLFSSDYPHWDTDDVDYIAKKLPREWLAKIYHENACAFYGWPVDTGGERASQAGAPVAGSKQPPADPVAPVEPFGDIL